jgi:hypothetical protein
MKEEYKYIVWTDEVDHYFKKYKQAKKIYSKLIKFNKYVGFEKIQDIVDDVNRATYESNRIR